LLLVNFILDLIRVYLKKDGPNGFRISSILAISLGFFVLLDLYYVPTYYMLISSGFH
jgi:hypothetical protein